MPPRATRSSTKGASTSKRLRRERTPSPPPPPLPWALPTREQNENYKKLSKRQVVPSKFFDPFTIHNLGLRGEVNLFIANIGWGQYAALNVPTYECITYEILSTLQSDFNPHDRANKKSIFFRCLGEDRSLTMQEFNAIFGFPNEGIDWNEPEYNPQAAWSQLTDQNWYNPSSSKASQLNNHSLRYIHRVMALSLFGRGLSTGVVSKVELLFLWGMANGIQVNTGVWFLRHLLHVAYMPTGKICVGGLLTVLANAFGFEPVEGVHVPLPGSNLVDIDTLINMRMCRHVGGGQYRLLNYRGQVIDIRIEDDIEQAAEEEAYQEQAAEEETNPQEEAMPDPAVDMSGFYTTSQATPSDQFNSRFDRLEAQVARQEEQLQMLPQILEIVQRTETMLREWKKD